MNKIFEIKNLQTHIFTGTKFVTPVRNLSLNIYENEILGLVGESGSGKSVTAHSLLRLYGKRDAVRYEGEINYRGRELLRLPEKKMRKLRQEHFGMIFQDAQKSLNPTKTVEAQLLDSIGTNRRMKKKEAEEYAVKLLTSCGLSDPERRLRAYPHELSGGMKQRIMIAMALSKRPDFLISDESTTALDVTTEAQILRLYKDLKRERGTSVLFITHDLSILKGFCDRLAVMYLGEIMESGTLEEITEHPLHPYTKHLLAASPHVHSERKSRLPVIPGRVRRLDEAIVACPFSDRCEKRMEICTKKHPGVTVESNEHRVRCFLYGEGGQ